MGDGAARVGFLDIVRRRPDFLALWFSQAVSLAGDRLTQVALAVHVLNLSGGSAFSVAVVLMSSLAPAFLFGWALGVYVDRLDKKRTMIYADIARALLIASVPLASHVYQIYAIAFLVASFSSLFEPAYQAAIPETVRRDELMAANSLRASTRYVVDIAAFAGASAVIGVLGVNVAFMVDVATYIVSAAAIATVSTRLVADVEGAARSFVGELREGLRYHLENRVLLSLLIVMGAACVGGGGTNALGVVIVERLLHMPTAAYGLLLSSQGVGMLLGAVSVGRFLSGRVDKVHMVMGGAALLGVSMMTIAFSAEFSLTSAAYFVFGLGNAIFLIPIVTWVQEVTPLALRGRVFSIRNVVVNLAFFVSMGVSGAFADRIGVSIVMAACAVLMLASAFSPVLLPGMIGRRAAGRGASRA